MNDDCFYEFIYETGPQDNYEGMINVDEYIEKLNHSWTLENLTMRIHVLEVVQKAMVTIVNSESSWEGDVRGNEIYIFSLPDPDNCDVLRGVIWKQDNNGTTFICSPVKLPWLEEYRLKFKVVKSLNVSPYRKG